MQQTDFCLQFPLLFFLLVLKLLHFAVSFSGLSLLLGLEAIEPQLEVLVVLQGKAEAFFEALEFVGHVLLQSKDLLFQFWLDLNLVPLILQTFIFFP